MGKLANMDGWTLQWDIGVAIERNVFKIHNGFLHGNGCIYIFYLKQSKALMLNNRLKLGRSFRHFLFLFSLFFGGAAEPFDTVADAACVPRICGVVEYFVR